MLARGLTHMEGVLADIAPDINMVEIAAAHMSGEFFRHLDIKKELKSSGKSVHPLVPESSGYPFDDI